MIVDPRTGLETLTDDECWELLGEGEIGRLAVAVDGRPDIFPVNYVVDGSDILIRTAAGFKLAAAVLGPAVAFEIDGIDPEQRRGWSVVVHGQATEIDQTEPLLRAEDLQLAPWAGGDKPRFIRIEVTEVTGRRIA
jgi:nitroimidazol reductase NimA-like FMN-containing flavoprotein (pyridoxamine 5'-phosphate oxidase superfamily)